MQKLNFLWKYEKFFFGTLILLFLIPIIAFRFFPTLDGPSHLYNGNLLNQLWFGHRTEILLFFDVNTHLETNWLNHIWFAILSNYFPSFIVEKSILVVYALTLPLSFRYLIKTLVVNPKRSVIASYLIFPFIYSFPFCVGFFNFCIGIPVLFWCTAFWIKSERQWNFFRVIFLLLVTSILYFAHLFNFLLFGLIVLCYETQQAISTKQFKKWILQLLILVITTLPGLLLSVRFIFTNNGSATPKYIDKIDLLKGIAELSPIITLDHEKEKSFALVIFYCLCLLIGFAFYNYIKNKKNENAVKLNNNSWLIASVLIFVLYLVSPDWMVSGGLISIRLALFFFLMLIIWIATCSLSIKQLLIPVVIISVTSLCSVKHRYDEVKSLSDDAIEIASAEKFIEEGKTLLPLNYSGNWLHSNFSNYIGAQKLILVLDNYEATKPLFPLIWKKDQDPYTLIGNFGSLNPCIAIKKYEEQTAHSVDYISRWCYDAEAKDSCTDQANAIIQNQFSLIYTSPHNKLQLFKRKLY